MKALWRWLALLTALVMLASVTAAGEGITASPEEDVVIEENTLALGEEGALTDEPIDGVPKAQDRTVYVSGKTAETMAIGDTLRLYIGIEGVHAVKWTSSKSSVATAAFNAATGECVVKGEGAGTTKLTAKLDDKDIKQIVVTLTVTDPNVPSALKFIDGGVLRTHAGAEVSLLPLLITTPAGIDASKLSWKVSPASVAKLTQGNGQVTLIALKAGKAKVTVTGGKKPKVRAILQVNVEANKLTKLCSKPRTSDIVAISSKPAWSLWPVSVEPKAGKIACEFYVLNNTGAKSTYIENLHLTIAAGSRGNIIACGDFLGIKISVPKNGKKSLKLTLTPTAAFSGVFLPDHYRDGTLYFDLNTDGAVMRDGKRMTYPFVPTVFPTITGKLVERVTLSETAIILGAGEQYSLSATALPEDAYDRRVKWTSSDPAVASVSDGVVTAVGAGAATVTAAALDGSGCAASCTVTVLDSLIPATAVVLSEQSAGMMLGDTIQLVATVLPDDATFKDVTWSSSDPAVASVSNGLVTALAVGEAKITATAADGRGQSASCDITVTKEYVPATGITLNPDSATIMPGQTLAIAARVQPSNATNQRTIWSSSDESVATVNNGVVRARATGTVTITAVSQENPSLSATCAITVTGNSLAVSQSDVGIYIGKTAVVTVSYYSTGRLNCVSSDDAVATGKWASSWNGSSLDLTITGVSEGKATLTITNSQNSDTAVITVNVTEGPVAVSSIELNKTSAELTMGSTLMLVPTIKPDKATDKRVTWSTSDAEVASVSADGVVTGVCGGTATITATAADGSGVTASCAVKVVTNTMEITSSDVAVEVAGTQAVKLSFKGALVGKKFDITWNTGSTNIATASLEGDSSGKVNVCIVGVNPGETWIKLGNTANSDAIKIHVTVKSNSGTGSYRALLVANDHYGSSQTPSTVNGKAANRLKNKLVSVYTPAGNRYQVTVKQDLRKADLINAISTTFSGAKDGDTSLFYIATHGDSTSSGTNAGALVMGETDTSKPPEFMTMTELANCLANVPGKIIVLLDSCGSGAGVYASNAAGNGEDEAAIKACEAFNDAVISAFAAADPGIVEPVISEGGIAANTGELRVNNKFYVLTASEYQKNAYNSIDETICYFTDWFIEGVGASGNMPADLATNGNKDGAVDLYELYKYIAKKGADKSFNDGGNTVHQNVQVYPDKYRYPMFK